MTFLQLGNTTSTPASALCVCVWVYSYDLASSGSNIKPKLQWPMGTTQFNCLKQPSWQRTAAGLDTRLIHKHTSERHTTRLRHKWRQACLLTIKGKTQHMQSKKTHASWNTCPSQQGAPVAKQLDKRATLSCYSIDVASSCCQSVILSLRWAVLMGALLAGLALFYCSYWFMQCFFFFVCKCFAFLFNAHFWWLSRSLHLSDLRIFSVCFTSILAAV